MNRRRTIVQLLKSKEIPPIPMSLRIAFDQPMHPVPGHPCRFVLVTVALIFLAGFACGQTSSPAFWELRPEQIKAMLLPLPSDEHDRYVRLHQYFSDLRCSPDLMQEQSFSKRSRKNLICILPGRNAEQIIVAARYDHRDRMEDAAQGWSEAVMLPILYNALQAQNRQHTFLFVELSGRAGEDAFLDRFRKHGQQPPKAMVVLDMLGLSQAWFYLPSSSRLSVKSREKAAINKRLGSEAAFTAHLQGSPTPTFAPPLATENRLLFEANKIPSILIYSIPNQRVPPQSFRQDFEFLGYYLCRIDTQLANPAARSNP
jgi:hypothetical protein